MSNPVTMCSSGEFGFIGINTNESNELFRYSIRIRSKEGNLYSRSRPIYTSKSIAYFFAMIELEIIGRKYILDPETKYEISNITPNLICLN